MGICSLVKVEVIVWCFELFGVGLEFIILDIKG